MQIKLTIALIAAGFAFARLPAFAGEMPFDGTKNFSAPSDAPSYFTNEAVPEAARVDHAVPFTREDVAEASDGTDAESAVSVGTGRHGGHTSVHRFGGGNGGGRATHHATATRTATFHNGSAHATTARGGGAAAGATKSNPARHAKANIRQHAAATPRESLLLGTEA
jgi:hypothetical protein